MSHEVTEFEATAAGSGEKATERFIENHGTNLETPKERVSQLATEVLTAVHDVIRRHKVTYDEYQAVKGWLIQVGEDGEWPLFMDVWVEHVVEEVATDHREGSKGSIEGPYYVPGFPGTGGNMHPADARRRARNPAALPRTSHRCQRPCPARRDD